MQKNYTNKKFLYPGTTTAGLYEEYHSATREAGVRVVGYNIFSSEMKEQNLSVFIPRKDQCDTCVKQQHVNINQTDYDAHIKAKDQARAEKNGDKEAASEKTSVWTMDLQAVLLCPQTKASAMYYLNKTNSS